MPSPSRCLTAGDALTFVRDRAVPIGVNRGAPPVVADTGSDFAKAIRVVAKSLLASEQPKKRRKFAALAKA